MPRVFTIGHSTRSLEEFIELLREHDIGTLVDVRRYPGSRRHPHFGSEALAESLREAGVRYVHEPDLGGRREPRPDSPNTAWRDAGFRAYADHMDTGAAREALARVEERAAAAPTAVMCAEAVHWRCHRRIIADVLLARGWDVVHILGPGDARPHELNPQARVLGDGRVVYPGGGGQLGLGLELDG